MAFLPAAIIDGALTYAESIRRLAYYVADSNTGVMGADHLAVTALSPTPGAAVNIAPGTGLIVSTYAGAFGQAYTVTNDATLQVTVPANGTGGTVTQRVLVTVRDPQYPGMPVPPVPATDLYLDVLVQPTFPTDRPYLHLADITMAAGASTVTGAMITPRVGLSRPRTDTDAAAYFPAATRNMSTTAYADWPQLGIALPIPAWATYCLARFTLNGVNYTGTGTGVGGVRVAFAGTADTQNGIIKADGLSRQTLAVMGRWNLPAGIRGTTQALVLQGYQTSGSGLFTVDYQSQILAEWTFKEKG